MYLLLVTLPLLAVPALAALPVAEELAALQRLQLGLTSLERVRGAVRQRGAAAGQCEADMQRWERGLQDGELWALRMADSWSKTIPGVLYGTATDYGDFDECLGSNRAQAVTPKFVLPAIKLASNRKASNATVALLPLPVVLRLGVCLPASCPGALISSALQGLADNLTSTWQQLGLDGVSVTVSLPPPFDSQLTLDSQVGPWHWLVLSLIFVVLLVPMLASAVDLYLTSSQNVEGKERWKLLLAFSLPPGYKRMLAKDPPNAITSLNGMRVLSCLYVIFGHNYSTYLSMPLFNKVEMDAMNDKLYIMFILNFTLSVDTFFAIGGMLCCMSVLREMSKTSGSFNWFSYAFYRFVRITPPVALLCFLAPTWSSLLTRTPYYLAMGGEHTCSPHWWIQLVYLSDYIIPDANCWWIIHLWYLAADMKLYLLAPVVLVPLYRWPKLGGIWLAIVTLAACVAPGVIATQYGLKHQYDMILPADQAAVVAKKLYRPMHAHAAPFLVGVIFGWFMHLWRSGTITFKLTRGVSTAISSGAFAILALVVLGSYIPYDARHAYNAVESFLFNAFYRPAWSTAILLLVVVCENHREGFLNSFFSWSGFTVLSRLSFGMYLVQHQFNFPNAFNGRSAAHWSFYYLARDTTFSFAGSALLATIMFLFVEQPCTLLIAEMKRKPTKRKVEKKPDGELKCVSA